MLFTRAGIGFRDLRHKPILVPEDVKARFDFAKKFVRKTEARRSRSVQLRLGNHHFKCATAKRGRKLRAKTRVRGVYRKRGKPLRSGHVKPNPKLKLATSAKGFLKAGGVGSGKVLVWHTITSAWCGAAVADLYSHVITLALRKEHPRQTSFALLEGNDPTGNHTDLAKVAKSASKLWVLEIPKRSPDLNVMGYAVWSEVERKLREQERKWTSSKKESRAAFEKGSDKATHNLNPDFIHNSIGGMQRRGTLWDEAKGGLFEEGGHRWRHAQPRRAQLCSAASQKA